MKILFLSFLNKFKNKKINFIFKFILILLFLGLTLYYMTELIAIKTFIVTHVFPWLPLFVIIASSSTIIYNLLSTIYILKYKFQEEDLSLSRYLPPFIKSGLRRLYTISKDSSYPLIIYIYVRFSLMHFIIVITTVFIYYILQIFPH